MCDKMAISAYILKIVEKDPLLRLQMSVKAAFIMYYLVGGRGFYKLVLHFLLSPRTVSRKFRLPPRGWIRFSYPPF